jgi:hypothetical protein
MRYLLGLICVLALGLVGCSETTGTGGSGGDGGTGGTTGQEFPCTEQGIVDAIAEGGGPHTFACDGPTTVVTESEIIIDNDVALDGEGNLTVDGNSIALPEEDQHVVFVVASGVTADLRRMMVTGGACDAAPPCQPFECFGCDAAIEVVSIGDPVQEAGTLTMTDCSMSGNEGAGIGGFGTVTVMNSTVSGNKGHGIEGGPLTVMNSTVSGNGDIGIASPMLSVTNSTVSENRYWGISGGGTINNSTLTGNWGGISVGDNDVLTVLNSTLSENVRPDTDRWRSASGSVDGH